MFKIKDLGEAKYFLRTEITKDDGGLVLSQRKYALDLPEDMGFTLCKPAATPWKPVLDCPMIILNCWRTTKSIEALLAN